MYDRKMKELTIEYTIINKIIRKLKIRKEQVWNELKTLEEEANGIR